MHFMRFFTQNILLGAIFTLPIFVFAQAFDPSSIPGYAEALANMQSANTTPADQTPTTIDIPVAKEINEVINDRMNKLPDIKDIPSNTIKKDLVVKTIPKYPGPFEKVQVTIESYLSDMNKASILWSLNGRTVESGIGKTSIFFQNGASGKITRLTIYITTSEGLSITKELTWNPISLTVLLEANTYTPPFYKGKPLASPESLVRAVAITENGGGQSSLNAGNFVYLWKKDGAIVPGVGGYGANSFSFKAPIPYTDASISVQASSVDNAIQSESRVKLPLSNPLILFYADLPLVGTWYNSALTRDITLSKKELSVSAEPYFFSMETSEASNLIYSWALNNKKIQNLGRIITLRNETGGKGDSSLSLAMRGTKQTFQSAGTSLLIHFTEEESAKPIF